MQDQLKLRKSKETMEDLLDRAKALAENQHQRNNELRDYFKRLNKRIVELLGNIKVYCQSDVCSLEQYGEDDSIYGFISFELSKCFLILYRSTDDDLADFYNGTSSEDGRYNIVDIDSCPIDWLRAISSVEILKSFFNDLCIKLEAQTTKSQASIDLLRSTLEPPLSNIQISLEAVARVIDASNVIDEWKKAQNLIITEPGDAITSACSFLESVCKHILCRKKIKYPQKQNIHNLLKATTQILKLTPGDQPSQDLKCIMSGINSIIQGVGSLRTHEGGAHGKGPDQRGPTRTHAKLAVNCAGVAATYLMEVLSAEEQVIS